MPKVLIIAEAGVNHNGSMELAKKLIDEAVLANCDYIKFQNFVAEKMTSKSANKADYQNKTTDKDESQLDMLKKLELTKEGTLELKAYCEKVGIKFLSTPFEEESLELLLEVGIDLIKIPSGDLTNLPFLRAINKKGLPVILSTGMATLDEIRESLALLKDCDVSLLHCTTEYPCPFEDVNLNAMQTMKEEFNLPIGYSDHTAGIEVPIAAVALGATIIEKHFTLDKNMEGPDHKASLEPYELKAMVSAIRNIEKSLGSFDKKPSPSEEKNIAIARKSIVAKKSIAKGEIFSEENLITKRPGNGVSPMKWDSVIGSTATRNYNEDELIAESK